MSARRNTAVEIAERVKRVTELRRKGKSAREIGRILGLSRSRVGRAMEEIYDLEEIDTTPDCARCGLRGEHLCIDVQNFTGRRFEQSCVRNATR